MTARPAGRDQDRLARAALTWLAEPADPQLTALLGVCEPAMVVAGIRQGIVPWPYQIDGAADLTAMGRWRARLPDLPDEDQIASLCRDGRLRMACPGDPEWPARLNDLGAARPYALWLHGTGDVPSCTRLPVSVTGSRAATGYGAHVAGEIARDLAGHGWVTVSGGAYVLFSFGVLSVLMLHVDANMSSCRGRCISIPVLGLRAAAACAVRS